VSPEEIVLSQVVVLVSAVFFASAGVFWSSVVRTSVASNVLTYGTMLFQMIGIPFIYLTLTTAFGLSQFGFGMSQDPLFFQFSMLVLSLQPIIAMSFSEAHYLNGDSLFFFTTDDLIQGENLLIVSPWLIFCIEALLLSALLVWLAVRRVSPVRHRRSR
jgi:hypothetical protein